MAAGKGKIRTVLVVQVDGLSRLRHDRQSVATQLLDRLRAIYVDCLEAYDGTSGGEAAENLIATFSNVVDALDCAVALQDRFGTTFIEDARLDIRMGLHLGGIIKEGGSVLGDGVLTASELCTICRPGGIVASGAVREQVADTAPYDFSGLGEHALADAGHPVNVFIVGRPGRQRSLRELFYELTRRRVFRTAAAYAVAAWLLVQVGDVVLPVFESPPWAMRALITLVVVGFPLAMLMTWSVNLSGAGWIRTPDSPLSQRAQLWLKTAVVSTSGLISAIVIWTVWTGFIESLDEPAPTRRAATRSQPVIAVAPLTKRIGSDEIDWLGEGISNLLRDSLADSPRTIVFTLAALRGVAESFGPELSLSTAAKKAGADYLVAGDLMQTNAGIIITTRIEDLQTGTIIPAERVEADGPAEALKAVPRILRRVRQSLNLPYEQQIGQLAADFAAANIAAYELYISGLEALTGFDYDNAIDLFRAAVAEAPDFGIARYRLAQTLESTGRNKEALAMLKTIDTTSLSERERLYIEGARHKFIAGQDLAEAIRIFRELVEKYPFDAEAHQNLAEAYWMDYQDEASITQLKQLVELHPQESASWMALGERQIDVGDTEGARESLSRYVAMRPDDAYPYALLGELASRQSQLQSARDHYEKALSIRPNLGVAEIGLARVEYASGNPEQAARRWQRISSSRGIEADYRIDAAIDQARIAHSCGRFAEVESTLVAVGDEIRAEGFREALTLSMRAAAMIELGRFDEAARLLQAAIEKTPASVPPIRQYLYRGWLSVAMGDRPAARASAEALRALVIDAEHPDGATRASAIDYLQGLAVLDEDPAAAATFFQQAIDTGGLNLRDYRAALADALSRAGRHDEAASVLALIEPPGSVTFRLDLEFERVSARLIRAELLDRGGDEEAARAPATEFLALWADAPPAHPLVRRARSLLD